MLAPNHVFVSQTDTPDYEHLCDSLFPELLGETSVTAPLLLLRNLFHDAGLDLARYGTPDWNPLGDLIKPGDKVLLKPNWVLDVNKLRGGGMDCLVTHTSVIEAVLHYVVKAQPGQIIVGDAPLQSCDFKNLRRKCGLDEMVLLFKHSGHDIQVRDFRLTKVKGLLSEKIKAEPDPEKYCLFDLGHRSWLTPITTPGFKFRVTNYDPDILMKHHNREIHQYLIAREVIDADVVINLPKLKTHKKAGVTWALKNVVGINGFKEYLPHHRKGGSQRGGDCYEGNGWLKKLAENSLDRANKGKSRLFQYFHVHLAGIAARVGTTIFGNDSNLEGAWYGNDTVWRMCLDLQRILHYGKSDGQLANVRQREVITITDAIIAGDGDGPLAPSPVLLGVMTLGTNVAALEWIHCMLMHLNPEKIPLVASAFLGGPWPLIDFSPNDIRVHVNGEMLPDLESVTIFSRYFSPPAGWRGHCEKQSDESRTPSMALSQR